MVQIDFSVPFCAGKARPRFVRGHAYKDARETMREEAIALAFGEAGGQCAPKGMPVIVCITAQMARKGHGGEPFTVKPDADNIAKLVLDALNGKAWHDDSQVTAITVNKLNHGKIDRITVSVLWREA